MNEAELLEKISKLRPSRRMIMTEYVRVRSDGTKSVVRSICNALNYKITQDRNKFVERVIRDFFKSN